MCVCVCVCKCVCVCVKRHREQQGCHQPCFSESGVGGGRAKKGATTAGEDRIGAGIG